MIFVLKLTAEIYRQDTCSVPFISVSERKWIIDTLPINSPVHRSALQSEWVELESYFRLESLPVIHGWVPKCRRRRSWHQHLCVLHFRHEEWRGASGKRRFWAQQQVPLPDFRTKSYFTPSPPSASSMVICVQAVLFSSRSPSRSRTCASALRVSRSSLSISRMRLLLSTLGT